MTRGTTQTLIFTLPEEIAIDALYITFARGKNVILEKTLSETSISGATVTVDLSQEETLSLPAGTLTVQLRLRDINGNALASDSMELRVDDVLKDGVI